MINIYFENIESEIIKLIDNARFNIKIAMSWFTNNLILESIINKLKEGVNVSIIINDDEVNNNKNSINFEEYIKNNGKLFFFNKKYFLHHKFLIIDESIVQTGSYNYTLIAENINVENIIVIKSNEVATKYNEEFNRLKSYSNLITFFKRNNKFNRIELPFEKIPQLDDVVSYEEFIVMEYENYQIARLKSLVSEEVVEVNVSDLSSWYEEGDFIKLKTPYKFMTAPILKKNFVIGITTTSIIENPEVIE